MEKHVVRKELLARRRQLSKNDYRRLSLQVQQQLLGSDCFVMARTLALYCPVNNEVQTYQLVVEALSQRKLVCFPRVNGDQLDFVEVSAVSELEIGNYNIAEPVAGQVVPVAQLDLIVVPGVAFDQSGGRLGYGKGFYDRELSGLTANTVTVGLSFDFQLCSELPQEDHDHPVQFLATQQQFFSCRNQTTGSP